MGASDAKSLQGFGFLTVLEDEQLGWIGGLLVVNAASRPLEFHCTAPVKPSRAQQILYGPTLAPYICGEQIGAALTSKANVQPAVYFTNVLDMLAVRPLVQSPVVYVPDEAAEQTNTSHSGKRLRIDAPHSAVGPAHGPLAFEFHQRRMCVDEKFAGDREQALAVLNSHAAVDLDEPFQRIQEALEETQLRKR